MNCIITSLHHLSVIYLETKCEEVGCEIMWYQHFWLVQYSWTQTSWYILMRPLNDLKQGPVSTFLRHYSTIVCICNVANVCEIDLKKTFFLYENGRIGICNNGKQCCQQRTTIPKLLTTSLSREKTWKIMSECAFFD